MIDTDTAISIGALLAAGASLVVSLRKKRGLPLAVIATQAVAYGEQMGETPDEKLRHALGAAKRLDEGDNGRRDWTDAQLRIAVEAELQKSKHPTQ